MVAIEHFSRMGIRLDFMFTLLGKKLGVNFMTQTEKSLHWVINAFYWWGLVFVWDTEKDIERSFVYTVVKEHSSSDAGWHCVV